jgi:hypothetical protein
MRLNVVNEVLNWLWDILPNQNWYAVFFQSGSGRKLDNPKPLNLLSICGVSKIQTW